MPHSPIDADALLNAMQAAALNLAQQVQMTSSAKDASDLALAVSYVLIELRQLHDLRERIITV